MGRNSLEDINYPNDMEIEILRILNGEDIPGWTWGAAMSACASSLRSMGYAEGSYKITEKGKKFLKELKNNS